TMDIGTAKPTGEERARIRHHLIDVADPGEPYDLLRYQRDGRAALGEVHARGNVALVVGGTGLYVRALLDGLGLASLPPDPAVRAPHRGDRPPRSRDGRGRRARRNARARRSRDRPPPPEHERARLRALGRSLTARDRPRDRHRTHDPRCTRIFSSPDDVVPPR